MPLASLLSTEPEEGLLATPPVWSLSLPESHPPAAFLWAIGSANEVSMHGVAKAGVRSCVAGRRAGVGGRLDTMILDARLRYEHVDQQPFAQDADALTLRARLGFETGKAWNTSLLVEGEAVVPLDSHYNSTTNGHVQYPVVADPEGYELNRLQLTNTSIDATTLTIGRQRITLDDHRFVGNVGWRQNEQTFDALRVGQPHRDRADGRCELREPHQPGVRSRRPAGRERRPLPRRHKKAN